MTTVPAKKKHIEVTKSLSILYFVLLESFSANIVSNLTVFKLGVKLNLV